MGCSRYVKDSLFGYHKWVNSNNKIHIDLFISECPTSLKSLFKHRMKNRNLLTGLGEICDHFRTKQVLVY